jgi:chromosome segregation ATPase
MNYHSLPDFSGYESKAAKRIARLAAEHTEKVGELGALGRDLAQARQDLEDAKTRDTEARARAARKGDRDPGRGHEDKARARLEDLQDKVGVMERVVADVERDLCQAITVSKADLLEEARAKREEAGERYTRAHRELREAHDEQRRHAGIARWTQLASGHFSPASPNTHVLSVPDVLDSDDPEEKRLAEVVSTEGARPLLRGA